MTIEHIDEVPANPRVKVDPRLDLLIHDQTAAERLETARTFEGWARQIRLQLTVCVGVNVMPPKNVRRIPEPRWFVNLQNN